MLALRWVLCGLFTSDKSFIFGCLPSSHWRVTFKKKNKWKQVVRMVMPKHKHSEDVPRIMWKSYKNQFTAYILIIWYLRARQIFPPKKSFQIFSALVCFLRKTLYKEWRYERQTRYEMIIKAFSVNRIHFLLWVYFIIILKVVFTVIFFFLLTLTSLF